MSKVELVLFDLDGTLADTAPDLAYALNQTLIKHGRAEMSLDAIRPHVSHGGIALIKAGFNIQESDPDFDAYRQDLLDIYQQNIARKTKLFPGMESLLDQLESWNIPWGVVTNKPSWLTDPLMAELKLDKRAISIVSSDTTSQRKPHPEPMYYACNQAGVPPENTLYVGDAIRDIEAGVAAGMTTLTALFGYIADEDKPETWGADGMIKHPLEILDWMKTPQIH